MDKLTSYIFPHILLLLVLLTSNSLIAQTIAINEVMASNASNITDEDGDNGDWIELYNYGNTAVNLTGFGLSDNPQLPFKWVFPSVTLQAKGYILVWATGKNRAFPGIPLHTNFSINTSGEDILLTAADGTLIDALLPISIPTDYSYGRYPDGTGNWFYYTVTTPNARNSAKTSIHPPETPTFSHKSGFYSTGFPLVLSHPDPKVQIIYTIDGSEPAIENLSGVSYTYKNKYPEYAGQEFGPLLTNTFTSITYTNPVPVSDRSTAPNKLANISSTWHYEPDYFPKTHLKKAFVVRAIAVLDGVSSETISHSFFVSATSAFTSKLPIASICLNENGLFDYNNGIYVAGKDFDNWRKANPNGITNGHRSANYRRTGRATEQAASFQYFVDGNEVVSLNIGVRMHGSFSKSTQNKTFRLYARSEYDSQNTFDYPFFGPNNSSSFKRLLMRNSGNDAGNLWIGSALVHTISPAVYFRDAFIQKMVSHLRFDTQDYAPVITYVNGEYWGILNLRERYDQYYLERKYGIKESELDLLQGNASVKIGSNSHYTLMRNFISSNDLSNENHFQYVKSLIDTDNFMDYQISQIYARNTDWPGNNIDYFRKRTEKYEPDAPYGQDGRWRWLMFDTDHGFGWSGGTSYTHNSLQNASGSTNWPTLILNKLLENQNFKNDFINRYADLLNTAFLPSRLIGMIDEMAANIEEEIPRHRERWNTLPNWAENVGLMRQFAELRPENARTHIRNRFSISRNIAATLDVSDHKHGFIHINTIDINEQTPGVTANPFPWSGTYFYNIPLSITAIPNPGFRFSSWSGANTSNEAFITVTPLGNFSLKANFIPLQDVDYELIYFWLFDSQIKNDTPLETLNTTYSINGEKANISFVSSQGEGYPFAIHHPSWRVGSMERRNAPTEINYCANANSNIEYRFADMKGIQLKDPFLANGHENTLVIQLSTAGYENVRLGFAAMDEGAAKKLKIEYFDKQTEQWTNYNIINSNPELTSAFMLYYIDFGNVQIAQNNPGFDIRIRFEGADLTREDGNRVTFNNFAVHGTRILSNNVQTIEPQFDELIKVFPNPTANIIYVNVSQTIIGSDYKILDVTGKAFMNGKFYDNNTTLDLSHLPSGVYLLQLSGRAINPIKIIKK